MKRFLTLLACTVLTLSIFGGCGTEPKPTETTAPATQPPETVAYAEGTVYHVGPTREHQSLTALFLLLKNDETKKTIYIDEGVYDIFKEYKEAGIPSPPDNVTSPDYFDYNAFLPHNTNLIGIGNVRLEFNPGKDEITYGESRTWSPLNVLGECYIENL